MTYYNSLLRIALHINNRIDMDTALIFLETFNDNFYRIWNFLVVITKYFLANYFRNEELCWLIRKLILIKISWTFRQKFLYSLH